MEEIGGTRGLRVGAGSEERRKSEERERRGQKMTRKLQWTWTLGPEETESSKESYSWEISVVLDLPNPAIQLITTGLYFFLIWANWGWKVQQHSSPRRSPKPQCQFSFSNVCTPTAAKGIGLTTNAFHVVFIFSNLHLAFTDLNKLTLLRSLWASSKLVQRAQFAGLTPYFGSWHQQYC